MAEQEGHPKSNFIQGYDKASFEENSCSSDSDSDDAASESFDDSSHDHNDSSEGTHRKGSDDGMQQIEDLARKETNFLRIWRLVVLLLIMGTCAIFATGTYILLRNNQNTSTTLSVSVKSSILGIIRPFSYPPKP